MSNNDESKTANFSQELHRTFEAANEILLADVRLYQQKFLEEEDNEFWRRGLIRAIFAYIEGLIFSMKKFAVFSHYISRNGRLKSQSTKSTDMESLKKALAIELKRIAEGIFTPYELLYLLEYEMGLNDKGEVKVIGKSKIPLLNNLLFAFRMYGKIFDIEFRLDKSGIGWQSLRESIKVRDRLMHPKKAEDLSISIPELDKAIKAYTWVRKNNEEVHKLIREKVKKDEEANLSET